MSLATKTRPLQIADRISKPIFCALLCAALAACGGGGGGSSSNTGTVTPPPPPPPPPPTQTGTLALTAGATTFAPASEISGIALDASGNLYLADTYSETIRKITTAGVVTTIAGTPGVTGSADGAGTAATFNSPAGIAVDASGNIYVVDAANYTVRKITPDGTVSTLAGQPGVKGITDGTGATAQFYDPTQITLDTNGNLYVVDTGYGGGFSPAPSYVREITPAGTVTTLYTLSNGDIGGFGIAFDPVGNLYLADSLQVVRIAPSGTMTTYPAGMTGITFDAAGNLYGTSGEAVLKIPPGSPITQIFPDAYVLAGSTTTTAMGSADGTGAAASFNSPGGIVVDAAGNAYVVDQLNQTVRKVTAAGVVTTLAGTAGVSGHADGTGPAAQFVTAYQSLLVSASGITIDTAGNIYVADNGDQYPLKSSIRKIAPNGAMTTLPNLQVGCGNGELGAPPNPPGTATDLCSPGGVIVDAAGDLYVANGGNTDILKITPGGQVSVVAGSPLMPGSTGGVFFTLNGIAEDAAGNLYVTSGTEVKKITPDGTVTTLAGSYYIGPPYSSADGIGSTAQFSNLYGIVPDNTGNLYVTDTDNNTIRKIAPDATVTTFAGTAHVTGVADGTGAAAQFNSPEGIAIDPQGNLYVADTGNATIRKITPAGVVTTVAGVAGKQGLVLGDLPGGLYQPTGIAVIDQNTLAVTSPTEVLTISLP